MSAMDTGSIAKPATVAALNAPQRVNTPASAGAVKTELAPEASVQQVPEAAAVRFDPSNGAQARAALDAAIRDLVERHIEIDPKTREVVYQTVDKESGEVIRQVPDQALLRLRAYAREMREMSAGTRSTRLERSA
jgi:flagellar protein FlaG